MLQIPIAELSIPPGEVHEWRLRARTDPATGPVRTASFNQEKHFAAAVTARRDLVSETYWIGLTFTIEGGLDLTALESALRLFVQRHEVLRCTFEQLLGDLRCGVMTADEVALEHTRIGRLDSPDVVRGHLERTFDRSINTLSWPLFLLGVVIGPDSSTVYMAFDHILCDGISLVVAVDEVQRAYAAHAAGRAADLPATGSYLDFGEAQRGRYADLTADGPELMYWRSFVHAAGELFPRIPLNLGLEYGRMYPARNETLRLLNDADATAFERRCGQVGGKMFMGLLAITGMALNQLAGTGTYHGFLPISERRDPRWRGAFGWFVNTMPISFPIDAELTFEAVLGEVNTAFRELIEHVDVPFIKAWELLAPEYFGLRTWPYPVNFFSYLDFRRLPGAEHERRWQPCTIPEASHSNTGNMWFYRNSDGLYLNSIFCDVPESVDAFTAYRKAIQQILEELTPRGSIVD